MERFTDTIHCTSKSACKRCRSSEKWRTGILTVFEWDGTCPDGHTLGNTPKPPPMDLSKYDLAKEQGVLDRMKERGCKKCEEKRQQRLVDALTPPS
jgi:hypothetical protein